MKKNIKTINLSHETIANDQISLQNLVEKYLPLRMLNMIVEVTEDCFQKPHKQRMREVAYKMGDIMRNQVLNDIGNPTLKEVCLSMITSLRLETAMLNHCKDGPAIMLVNKLKPEQFIEKIDGEKESETEEDARKREEEEAKKQEDAKSAKTEYDSDGEKIPKYKSVFQKMVKDALKVDTEKKFIEIPKKKSGWRPPNKK